MSSVSVVVLKIVGSTNKADTPFILHVLTIEVDPHMMLVNSSVEYSNPNSLVGRLSMFIHIAFE